MVMATMALVTLMHLGAPFWASWSMGTSQDLLRDVEGQP
jgi:hypothetical protein